MENENGCIPFLQMSICGRERNIETSWYSKPMDTGLMSFHYCAPKRHGETIVGGIIDRTNNAISTWHNFDDGLKKATRIWESNQFESVPTCILQCSGQKNSAEVLESDNTNALYKR